MNRARHFDVSREMKLNREDIFIPPRRFLIIFGTVLLLPILAIVAFNGLLHLCTRPTRTAEDIGWLPPSAQVLLFHDDHGGFHGDGTTFLIYRCRQDELPHDLRPPPVDQETIDRLHLLAQHWEVPSNLMPDLTKASIRWVPSRFIVDLETNQVWYLTVTT